LPYQTEGAVKTAGRRGRPATASREDVLRLARAQFLAGQRVDVSVVARELGLGRATIYRWFGSRDGVLGEVIVDELQVLLESARRRVRLRGAKGLLEVFDRVNRALSRSQPLRRLLEQEREGALRLLTSGGGPVQARAVAAIQALIDDEVSAGRYDPPADTVTLAYAIVRLADAFLYNDAAVGIRGDWERLRQIEAALLGVRTGPKRARGRPTPARAGKRATAPGAGARSRQAREARPESR
jgi:AcrR family transcriptional regulator